MHPKKHIIYGTVFSVALYFLINDIGFVGALIIWFSSWFLIDLDHIMRYTLKTGSFSLVGFWKWSVELGKIWNKKSQPEKKAYKIPIYIFHGIEPLIILFVLAYLFPVVWFVLIGVMFHMICDLIDLYQRKENVLGKLSIIYVLIHNINKKHYH